MEQINDLSQQYQLLFFIILHPPLSFIILYYLPTPNKRGQIKTAPTRPIDGTSNGIIQALYINSSVNGA